MLPPPLASPSSFLELMLLAQPSLPGPGWHSRSARGSAAHPHRLYAQMAGLAPAPPQEWSPHGGRPAAPHGAPHPPFFAPAMMGMQSGLGGGMSQDAMLSYMMPMMSMMKGGRRPPPPDVNVLPAVQVMLDKATPKSGKDPKKALIEKATTFGQIIAGAALSALPSRCAPGPASGGAGDALRPRSAPLQAWAA